MKKFTQVLSAIVCIGAVMFLAGEWPEDTPRKKAVTCDASALVIALATGLYLKRSDHEGRR